MRGGGAIGGKAGWLLALLLVAAPASAGRFTGHVVDDRGEPLAGAFVTVRHGAPAHAVTVFTDAAGRFATPELEGSGPWLLRARRIGWRDVYLQDVEPGGEPLEIVALRLDERSAVAHQLPANHWYGLVLARIEDPELRYRMKRECTYCHQQGSQTTRRPRSEEEWRKLLALMGRRGAMLPTALREALPTLFDAAYDPATASVALTPGWPSLDAFAPPPAPEVRGTVIEEWDLGGRASMQHDVVVHPDGRIYAVDGTQDRLYRLDPSVPDGARSSWPVPDGGRPLGGVFGTGGQLTSQTSNAHVGPHSLQVAPDGSVWITLATGNLLARFDPTTERFELHEVEAGFYPHTLRFDGRGRFWYTMAASNHVGRYDPATGEQVHVRLPARTWAQAVALRLMPAFMWLGRRFDLRGTASEGGDGFNMPVPYGIDVAPDGGVWFSQLNEDRIGRIDPDTLEVRLYETPFPAPRRLRFDARGVLWVPSFSAGLLAAFDPTTGEFRSWPLPIRPLAGETPYALHVDPASGDVWICGTNSDSLIRFHPASGQFDVYPLPTRVTYTREIDFDARGRVWTSNSNSPAWHIEDGQPKVLRLDPGPRDRAARAAAAGFRTATGAPHE